MCSLDYTHVHAPIERGDFRFDAAFPVCYSSCSRYIDFSFPPFFFVLFLIFDCLTEFSGVRFFFHARLVEKMTSVC